MPGAVGSTAVAVAGAQAPRVVNTLSFVPGSGGGSALLPLCSAQAVVRELSPLRGSAAGCRYQAWA